jgi:hypothetical protein
MRPFVLLAIASVISGTVVNANLDRYSDVESLEWFELVNYAQMVSALPLLFAAFVCGSICVIRPSGRPKAPTGPTDRRAGVR